MPPAPGPQQFVERLAPAIEQAASIAAALEGRVGNRPKANEATDVKAALTVADTAAQEALLVPLLAGFSHAQLEAEEDTANVALFTGSARDTRIVIDPIDGTLRFFLEGLGPYAVMAGLALRDRYEAALVALPREHFAVHAVRGSGARSGRIGGPLEAARLSDSGGRLLVSDGVPAAVVARLAEQGFEPQAACGGAVAVAPLLPGTLGGMRVAKSASISTRGRIGLLASAEAGARIETGDGKPFPDHLDEPAASLIAAVNEDVARAMREALRAS